MESSSDGEYEQTAFILKSFLVQSPDSQFLILSISIVLLLLCSAFFSGAEVAFFSLGNRELLKLKDSNSNHSKRVIKLLQKPKYLLSTLLIANNLANVGIVIITSFVLSKWFNFEALAPWAVFLIQVVLITSIILLIGEIAPKVLATKKNIELAKFMAMPVELLKYPLMPLNYFLVSSTKYIENKLEKKKHTSAEELEHAIELTIKEGNTPEERKILKGLVKFGHISVKQIMKNRTDVVSVSSDFNFKQLLTLIKGCGFSRIPVYEENIDNIKGILYTKDLLNYIDVNGDFKWQKLIKKPFFVPETKKVSDLLNEFQEKKIHLAIVVDEYGGTAGIVTLEDVLEEIVGDITDEFDPVEIEFVKVDNTNFIFEGKTLLSDIIKTLRLEDDIFNDIKGEADSLGGMILELTGKMPKFKDRINHKNFTFTVESVESNRINKVRITLNEKEFAAEKNT